MNRAMIHDEMLGKRFGKLLVLRSFSEKDKEGCKKLVCQCDCGNLTVVTAKNLKSGNTKSCGCMRHDISLSSHKDMTGMRFGKLLVMSRAGTSKNRTATWNCLCDCGNECVVSGSYLRQGDTTSCGCFQKERISQRSSKDLTNMKFGKLTALHRAKVKTKKRGVEWVCRCECGNTCIAVCEDLCSGGVKSCGCLQSSGEKQISDILKSYGVRFVRQMRFDDCKDVRTLPFDFYLPELRVAIEFQG